MSTSFNNKEIKNPLNLLLFPLIILYAVLVFNVLGSTGYLPYHEDETINYNSGRLFYETNSLQAPYCFNESVSPVFSSNWYGFFYNIFYGGIAKIFGLSSMSVIVINVMLLLISFYVLMKMKIDIENKKYFAIMLFLIPNVVYFLFGYWPVIINLALALSLIYLLVKINEKVKNNLASRKIKMLYVILCIFYILVNPLWAIWSVAIIPFSKGRKELFVGSVIFIFVMLISFVYIKLFCAQWITGNTTIMFYYLFRFELFHFVHLIRENFFTNLTYFYQQNLNFIYAGNYDNVINQFLLAVLLFFSPVLFIIKKERFHLIISLITTIIFIVLFTIYTPEFEYFQRILTPVYVLLLFSVCNSDLKIIKRFILILLIISFPFSLKNSVSLMNQRKQMFTDAIGKYADKIEELRLMQSYMLFENDDLNKPAAVQWVYFEHEMPRALFLLNIPLSDKNKQPLIYTSRINCFVPSLCDSLSAERKFEVYNKLTVKYALSKNKIDLPGYVLLADKQYFKLYAIKKVN